MRINQGNLLRVIHETGCTLNQAEKALKISNNWIDTFRNAKTI